MQKAAAVLCTLYPVRERMEGAVLLSGEEPWREEMEQKNTAEGRECGSHWDRTKG